MNTTLVAQLYSGSTENLDQDVVLADMSDSLEAATLDVEDAYDEAEESAQAVDQLEDIADGLESLLGVVTGSVESGGLSPQSAMFMQRELNMLVRPLGLAGEQLTPSHESFGGDSERAVSTEATGKGIADTLKKVWNTIKTAIQRAMAAVADFFAKLFSNVDKLIARANATDKMVGELEGSPEGELTLPAANLHVGGKADVNAVKTGLGNLVSVLEGMNGQYLNNARKYYNTVASGFAKVEKADSESDVKAVDENLKGLFTDVTKVVAKIGTAEISGGRRLVTTAKTEGDSSEWSIPKLESASKASSGDTKVKTPSKADLSKMTGDVVKIGEAIKASKDNIKKLADERKAAMDKADGFVKASDTGRLKEFWNTNMARMQLKKAQYDLTRPVTQLNGHAFSVGRAALSFVESSAKNFKK